MLGFGGARVRTCKAIDLTAFIAVAQRFRGSRFGWVRNVRSFPTTTHRSRFPTAHCSAYVPFMRNSVAEFWPRWVETVGDMIEAKTIVRAACVKCRNFFDVDLAAILAIRGARYSLIDKRPRCKISTCRGKCFFLAAASSTSPLRPLVTDATRLLAMFGMRSIEDVEPPPDPPRPRPPAAQRGGAGWNPMVAELIRSQKRSATGG